MSEIPTLREIPRREWADLDGHWLHNELRYHRQHAKHRRLKRLTAAAVIAGLSLLLWWGLYEAFRSIWLSVPIRF